VASRRRQALLLVLAAALSAFTILRDYGPHDEGLMLQWAGRIASGQWPYRDFWSNYAPGQPVLLAGLVKLFGPSLLWWRVLRVAIDAVTALLAYRLVRRDAPEGWALAAWVAVAGAMAFPTGPGPNPTALLLAFAALAAGRRSPGAGGALAGLAVLVRPEIGIAAALGVALSAPRPGMLRALAPAVAVAVAGLAPFALVAGGDMADQTIGFLGRQDLQRLPFPLHAHGLDPNKLLELYLPLILLVAVALWALALAMRRPGRRDLGLVPLVALGVAYLLARTDEFHLIPLSAALAVGLAIAGARTENAVLRGALALALGLVALHGVERRAGQLVHPPVQAAVPAPAADGVRTSRADAAALARLIPAVQRRTPRGEPVLVAPPRFDRVRVGDPMLYVLLDRPNPTRYDVMQPGVVTTATVQREMLRDLARTRTPVVVRWEAPAARALEPNGSARSSGVHILDRYIARRYERVARYGDYVLLARRATRLRRTKSSVGGSASAPATRSTYALRTCSGSRARWEPRTTVSRNSRGWSGTTGESCSQQS
jgi:hypothetical protein